MCSGGSSGVASRIAWRGHRAAGPVVVWARYTEIRHAGLEREAIFMALAQEHAKLGLADDAQLGLHVTAGREARECREGVEGDRRDREPADQYGAGEAHRCPLPFAARTACGCRMSIGPL